MQQYWDWWISENMKSILQNQIGERGCIYVLLNESFDVDKKLTILQVKFVSI